MTLEAKHETPLIFVADGKYHGSENLVVSKFEECGLLVICPRFGGHRIQYKTLCFLRDSHLDGIAPHRLYACLEGKAVFKVFGSVAWRPLASGNGVLRGNHFLVAYEQTFCWTGLGEREVVAGIGASAFGLGVYQRELLMTRVQLASKYHSVANLHVSFENLLLTLTLDPRLNVIRSPVELLVAGSSGPEEKISIIRHEEWSVQKLH